MPHDVGLILTFTGGLAAALLFGLVTQRLRLSPTVGYLLAGVAVGPFTPGFVAHAAIAEQLAEMGVVLLMFGVGLHFHVRDLLAVRRVAVSGALVQIAAATALGALVGRSAGWSLEAGIVFGLAISVASTVVLLRVLADAGVLHTHAGHVAVGWLLVEDIFTVLALVLLPIVAGAAPGGSAMQTAMAIGIAVAKIALLVALSFVVGRRLIPRLLASVARTRSRELFTLTVLVVALGIAVGSAKLFGTSMALGAFLAGMVVGQSELSSRAASEALPMRDAFAVLFFVSIGMLFDPKRIFERADLLAGTLAVILVGKPVAALILVCALRCSPRTAATVAIALAQVGEFSFIVAALGRQIDVLPAAATQVLVASSIVSITLNPLLFRLVEPLARRLSPRAEPPPPIEPEHAEEAGLRAIVVGYGPVGGTLVRLLRDQQLEPTVIELNHETVAKLRAQGIRAVYGDASQREILEAAGVRHAGSIVFSASGAPGAVVHAAKELNPNITTFARATYASEAQTLKRAGADVVVTAEVETALAMAERILARLGASSEQIDRARDKLREELGAPMRPAPTE